MSRGLLQGYKGAWSVAEIVKFTDYLVYSPQWFIRYLKNEIAKRDIGGVTASRIMTINVTVEHPLVQAMGRALSGASDVFAGLLPSICVTEGDENEEGTPIGQGQKEYGYFSQSDIDNQKTNFPMMEDRVMEGIITDTQLSTLQSAISVSPSKKLPMSIERFWVREEITVGLWAHSIQERQILGMVLRSILFDMKKAMIGKGLTDISIRTAKGLVNQNFGKQIFGQETFFSLLNKFWNYTVFDSPELPTQVDVHGQYVAPGRNDIVEDYPEDTNNGNSFSGNS